MNAKRLALFSAILATIFLAVPSTGVAQGEPEYPYDVDTRLRRGFLTDAMTGSGVDAIDSVSGNLHLEIPIASLAPGPAGSGFDLTLVYNSSIWEARGNGYSLSIDPPIPQDPYTVYIGHQTLKADAGWRYNYQGYRIDREEKPADVPDCNASGVWRHRLRIGLPDGSLHTLFLQTDDGAEHDVMDGEGFLIFDENGLGVEGGCAGPGRKLLGQRLTYYTVDGSYLKLEIDPDDSITAAAEWILHYPDGRRVHGRGDGVEKIYDPNGNWVEFSSEDCVSDICTTVIRDQYHQQFPGREIRIQPHQAGNYDDIQVPTDTGTVTWRVNWGTVTIDGRATSVEPLSYEFYPAQPDSLNLALYAEPSGTHRVVESIMLPNAGSGRTSYQFDYDHNPLMTGDQYRWGELTQMIAPTGATYKYKYKDNEFNGTFTRIPPNMLRNPVVSKTVTASGETRTWNYAYTETSTTITGPDAGVTLIEYKDPNELFDPMGSDRGGQWDRGLIHTITNPDGSVIARTWKRNAVHLVANWDLNPNNPYVEREEFTPSGAGAAVKAVTDFTYDKNGNLLFRIEKNWDGTQARKLVQTFHHAAPADEADSASVEDNEKGYWRPHATPWTNFDQPRRLNAVKRREIWGTETTPEAVSEFAYDEPYRSGNVTREVRWDDVQAASATTPLNEGLSQVLVRNYHANGNLRSISAPEIPTAVAYDDRLGALSSPYPTRVTYGTGSDQRVFSYAWNYKTGNLISWTDADNSVTTSYLYDGLGRRMSESQAGLRKTITEYDDSNLRVTEKRDLDIFDDGKLRTITHYDALGRVTLVRTNDGPEMLDSTDEKWIEVRTDYAMVSGGQRTITSTPFRQLTDPTVEWTCVQQDSIGRTKAIGVFKGSARPASCTATANRTGLTEFSYDRNMTRITEKAPDGDVVRDEVRDALGRLTEVTEDPGAGNLAYDTAYTYDPLDNLLTVTQDIQTRRFVYSSLSRLRSATNPESGTTHYCYDAAGNLTSRTDARVTLPSSALDTAGHPNCPANAAHTTATYVYDDLQRLDTVTYSDTTPDVAYVYHTSAGTSGTANIGRLKSIVSDAAEAIYKSYDALGRVTSMSQTIAGHPDTFSFAATYYLNDALESQTYPSGRMVTYDVDDAGRVEDVSDGTTTYADIPATAGHAYAPDGRLQRMKLGNNLWETRDYHTPGTPTLLKLVTPDEMTMLPGAIEQVALGYNYSGTANNGNLMSHTITRPGRTQPWTQTFTYDAANRLETARETGGYDREFGYDRYGNRWVKPHPVKLNNGMTQTDMHEPKYATQFDAAKNQLASPPMVDYYDAAGNQTMYSPYTLAYDAENRLKSMTHTTSGSATYLYDGAGRRVRKTWTPGGGTAEDTYYVYDIVGNLAAEYGTGTAPPSGTLYPFTDILGSVRAVTDAAGAVIECYDYLPFGRMLSASDNGRIDAGCHPPTPDASLDSDVSQKFTGQLRDEETRLDYFNARYLSAPEGRFLSADPLSGWPGDTQSWNGYAYARNNPLLYTDPTGERYRICVDGGECFDVSDDEYWLYIAEFGTYGYGLPEHPTTPYLSCAASGSEEGRQHYCLTVVYRSPDPAELLIDVMGQRADTLNSVMNVAALGVLGAPALGAAAAGTVALAGHNALTSLSLTVAPHLLTRLMPAGMTANYFGETVMRWGRRDPSAIARIGSISLQHLQRHGITREMAVSWHRFYAHTAKVQPENPSAAGRAKLMKAIVDLFDGRR